ncbi:MAG: hypothetical protein A4E65_02370 [Syntrophorhabdus sp. PtaU1.Bin153]|nr:MAG: hypothetical protein A4E65_02370 [Syntrophorhabdus sp. PtaU1.Bin153]
MEDAKRTAQNDIGGTNKLPAGRGKVKPAVKTTMDITDRSADVRADFPLRELGISFDANVLDWDECRRRVVDALHGGKRQCPTCGEKFDQQANKARVKRFNDLKRIRCQYCGKWFTAFTGTILFNTRFDVRQIVVLAFMLSIGQSVPG